MEDTVWHINVEEAVFSALELLPEKDVRIVLRHVRNLLDNYADVDDGQPNDAMRLESTIHQLLGE